MANDDERVGDDLRFWEYMAFIAYLIGLIAIGIFAWGNDSENSLRIFGVLWLVGTAAWLAGTVLGFLFGVPRVRAGETTTDVAASTSVVPNTNLEQISDWLTKIIVGATLVQLGPLADAAARLAVGIGNTLEPAGKLPDGPAAAGAVLVLYFAAGFVWGYLWCSLRVFREMQALVQRERGVRNIEASAVDAQDQA
ncbi:hypothetical protein ASE90_11185 [Sphingomonas sp. Leaf67]|uniref:hypothetical protein n=1 Tax=unclassified Sphingomonas TaxID=196159 RepID=UPI0006F57D49|nr:MULTISPECIES: hypothetical protein [unclassified Sphingomonas]KQN74688.1 hypothetical protein ASE91_17195 [Sphingomonas sp. Leaf62]KQN82239.1 hypothetical protein ASE90_11185 [Sphingomonas sp. Leaf67]